MSLKKYCVGITMLISTTMVTANQFTKEESKSNNSFTFAVMADTQAFRLQTPGDPDSESFRNEWRRINNNLVSSLNKIPGVEFGLINGDITEFGRDDSWSNVLSIYNKLRFPYFMGLGNHDYANNVNDCWHPAEGSMDGCAVNSIKKVLDQVRANLPKLEIENFSSDWDTIGKYYYRGSLSYSWDYKGVHFVQLNNHPNYKVKLKAGFFGEYTYDILPSLTWLADDLRRARFRGVKDIILNFHQYQDQFESQSNDYARKQFNAIMKTYKPLAVFVGHFHDFNKDTRHNDPWYGDTTIYTTSAAFRGQYHLVTYDNGKLTAIEMDGSNGEPVKLRSYTENGKIHKPICKLTAQPGRAGDIYISTFLPTGIEWNLKQVLQSGNVLDASEKGEAYMRPWNEGNPFQIWGFEKAYGDSWPEYNSWYLIRHLKTGKVLESNSDGKVYISNASPGHGNQQWRPIKTENGSIMLLNRATNQFLDGSGDALYTNPGFDLFNQFKTWEINHGWHRQLPENNRYFRAKTDNAWKSALPNGRSSNNNWEYLSSHYLLAESPCIAW